jgi:hypothetical protein
LGNESIIMKSIILCFLCVLLGGVTACRVAHGESATQQTQMVDQYGEWKCFPNLTVVANPTDRKISVKRLEADGSTSQTAADWHTGEGWFVFVESPERIWIYNGESLRLLLITPRIGSAIYIKEYPVPVPSAVKSRLAGKPQ